MSYEKYPINFDISIHKFAIEICNIQLFIFFSSCEIRPGPEYVLRQYTFDNNGRFFLIQHHYWDDSCSTPQLSVFANGRIVLRNSLIQVNAASSLIKISNITIVPQDMNAAKELDRVVAMECPGEKTVELINFIIRVDFPLTLVLTQ